MIDEAIALHQKGRLAEAVELYRKILAQDPNDPDALHLLGVVEFQLRNSKAALALLDRAVAINARNAAIWSNRGAVLHALRRFDDSIASSDQALAIKPDYPDALYNRGIALHELGRFADAIASYDRALRIKPREAKVHNSRSHSLQALNRLDEAIAGYDRALAIDPQLVEALSSRGDVQRSLRRFEDAIDSYERALTIKPAHPYLFGEWLLSRMRICDWRGLDDHLEALGTKLDREEKASPPFHSLIASGSPARQRRCAEVYVRDKHPERELLAPREGRYHHGPIRLGYFSADFHNHATAYLTAELFERHDRAAFEVFAFSLGPPRTDAMRTRLEKSFDRFVEAGSRSDAEVASLARTLGIDIAVDLKGFTSGSRTGIFALRAAPIQVNYLGYPGTMGAAYIDYLIADPTLIPVGHQQHYTEKIAYLPESYQVNDSKRPIAERVFDRDQCGLPGKGFVFCCFNKTYKILPRFFEVWMRLLRRVDGSVLWLFADTEGAATRLRAEAHARGIDPARLIFAERLAHSEHLARHRLADLFLDTLPCNAHTTASDALWAGLPVLTCLGETFAGRVAASLLQAIGLPELVARDLDHYEALALELATNPQKLLGLKQKLSANRLSQPLFNTARFTKHIEAAYVQMWQRHQSGLAPEHIHVRPADETN